MRRVITTRGTTQITENFKFPVTYRTLTSPLPLRSNTEGVYSLSLSVLRLRGDKSLESLTIASHQPATLSRLHNPTVLVIVVFVIFKFCFELYYSVFDLSIVFLHFFKFYKNHISQLDFFNLNEICISRLSRSDNFDFTTIKEYIHQFQINYFRYSKT